MFKVGEYVVSGSKGVCEIAEISTLNISGVDKTREYYILRPVYSSGSTVYLPVDSAEESIRKILSRDEAMKLVDEIPNILLIDSVSDKLLEQKYKECMRSNDCSELVKVMKTIISRKNRREKEGRKCTAVDAKYLRLASDNLYGELALSLGIAKDGVEDFVKLSCI